MANNEQRAQERFILQLPAKLSTEAGFEGNKLTDESVVANISSSGAFLFTKRKLPLASKVYIEFFIDLEDLKKLRFILSLDSLKSSSGKKIWVKATGIVVRGEEKGLAIIFDQDYQLSPMEALDRP